MSDNLHRLFGDALSDLRNGSIQTPEDGKAFLLRLYRKSAAHLAETLFMNFTTNPGWDPDSAKDAALTSSLNLVEMVKDLHAQNGITDAAFDIEAGTATFVAFHSRLEELVLATVQPEGGVQ